jgi:hypothetical protein
MSITRRSLPIWLSRAGQGRESPVYVHVSSRISYPECYHYAPIIVFERHHVYLVLPGLRGKYVAWRLLFNRAGHQKATAAECCNTYGLISTYQL